ncbi:efflux RND transporter periplasmic adaptor subunit [Segetibacter koreensis]|uniref:efflux RND transporter periplasmic adaptor subunit n=1 Tax=Segetibacter koreensis TaxID=398037 RepID=UPI0003610977|nr:efflux RND transporter periplasmic adaptor subunit [Segetibacter koreensis]
MKRVYCILFCLATLMASSCKSKEEPKEEDNVAEEVQTPVTVTNVSNEALKEYVELNAMSSFLQSSFIKATANGYIKSSNIKLGQFVHAGQLAFIMQTKEAKALGNTINELDSSFRFSGLIKIHATQTGYITAVDHQPGDYVQDGEQVAVLSDAKSFGFLLNLPYELRQYLMNNKTVEVVLPDKTVLKGTVAHVMPAVDSVSQTEAVLIKVDAPSSIPQNLIGRVRIVKNAKNNATSLPKEAVLTDESQNSFWVMKMIDSVTAVKVPVVKGIETGDKVEIVQPSFSPTDKIIIKGNYGLPDTAKVKVLKE